MLDSDIYIIPVRLEKCKVPETLCKFQWVNLFEEDGWSQLIRAIQAGMERRMGESYKTPVKEEKYKNFFSGRRDDRPKRKRDYPIKEERYKNFFREYPINSLYYCRGLHCLVPRHLKEMLFGCVHQDCSFKPENLKDVLPENLNDFFKFKNRDPFHVRCKNHHLPIVPKCPVCLTPIRSEDKGNPLGFWAGPDAGKTVYSAVVAREMKDQLYNSTGIIGLPSQNNQEYYQKNTEKLYKEGILPEKTKPGESSKIVYFLQDPKKNWTSRAITITDMSGELWTKSDKGKPPEEILTLMYSKESLFLINPQAATGKIEGTFESDISSALKIILQILFKNNLLEDEIEDMVTFMLKRLSIILNDHGFQK